MTVTSLPHQHNKRVTRCVDCGIFTTSTARPRKRCPECAYKRTRHLDRERHARNRRDGPPVIYPNAAAREAAKLVGARRRCEHCLAIYSGEHECRR
jgi:hypothetical protein